MKWAVIQEYKADGTVKAELKQVSDDHQDTTKRTPEMDRYVDHFPNLKEAETFIEDVLTLSD